VIVLERIASYVPPGRESNFDRAAEFALDRDFIVDKLGVETVSRKAPDEETSDLCMKAAEALEAQTGGRLDDVDCLVVCTQNPDGDGIPHTSAVVHAKLKLSERCACFDISLGCSGYVYGLSVVSAFIHSNGLRTGLLFTADPYSKIIDRTDRSTALLFGDAAAVTLLREAGDAGRGWVAKRFAFGTRGADGAALHNRGKRLVMDGRAIFNFSVTQVPLQVGELLKGAGLTPADVDLFLLHQGSKFIVDQLTKRLGVPAERVPLRLAAQGNTVSSSLPLLLEETLDRPELRHVVMSGFGVGLSWASCLLGRAAAEDRA